MDTKAKIAAALKAAQLTTIATANPQTNQPESALVGFAEDDQLNIHFQTGNDTRKRANLNTNPKVAFVIGFDKITVQYEGSATAVSDEAEIQNIKDLFLAKGSPASAKFLERPNITFFKVTPTWIAYSDYSSGPPVVEEVDF